MEYNENNFHKYYKDSLWKWVLLYIGVGIFCYLVIFHLILGTFERSKPEVKQSQQKQTVTSAPALIGWNSYKNSEYGFDLRYPENLAFIKEKKQAWSMHFYYKNNSKEGPLQISIVTDDSFLLDDNDIVGERSIGGVKGKTYVTTAGNGEFQCEQTVVYRKNAFYVFEDNCGQDKALYERMLSTFRFVDAQSSAADWKTYKNDGFEFQYPGDWEASEGSGLAGSTPAHFIYFDKKSPTIDGFSLDYRFGVTIVANPKSLSAKDFVQEYISNHPDEIHFEKQYDVTINGIPAYKLEGVFGGDARLEYIYIANDSNIFLFEFPVARPNPNFSVDPIEYNKISHKMLSTFKFTQ